MEGIYLKATKNINLQERFEDNKGVYRRTDNTMTKRKKTNNDLQYTTQTT
jgi:hypothetical protein